jgi:hypothetical protein
MVVGSEHIAIAAAIAAVVAGIVVVRIVGDCPNFAAVVVDAADPQVGYIPYGSWEKHRKNYHCQWIQASSSFSFSHRPQQRPSSSSLG